MEASDALQRLGRNDIYQLVRNGRSMIRAGRGRPFSGKPPVHRPARPHHRRRRSDSQRPYAVGGSDVGRHKGHGRVARFPKRHEASSEFEVEPPQEITGAGLESLKRLKKLEDLSLDGTSVNDAGLKSLRIEKPEVAALGETRITDAGLSPSQLKSLRSLHLGETRITDAGLVALRRATCELVTLLHHGLSIEGRQNHRARRETAQQSPAEVPGL